MKMSTPQFHAFLRTSFPQCTSTGLYEGGYWDVANNPDSLGVHDPDVVIASGWVVWNHCDRDANDAVDAG